MLLSNLLANLPFHTKSIKQDCLIKGITYDSRQVEKDYLFVAVKGYTTNGHLYIPEALKRGACAVLLQEIAYAPSEVNWVQFADTRTILPSIAARFHGYPASKLKMIGVTGTNGKTTTTKLIEAIYREQGLTTGLIGTVHNSIGDRILPVERTTPESADLQKLLWEMVDAQLQVVVMEVSSHALALHRVDECEFDTAIFTNLTQDHLDFHGTMEDYLAAKCLLFSGLHKKNAKPGSKYAVINADDPAAAQIKASVQVKLITYGINNNADVQAQNVRLTTQGTEFKVKYGEEIIELKLKLIGLFNVYNTLAALAAGVADNIPLSVMKKALSRETGVSGRFELINSGQDFAVIVDYAHTPDGLENVLKTAASIATGKLITVFGCGGDRDRTKRPLMGEIAAKMSDYTIVTSDNPRSEDPKLIIDDICVGINKVPEAVYQIIEHRRNAIRQAVCTASPGDVVLIAGKGHEDYQLIQGQRLHFDDREEAKAALEELILNS